MSSVEQKILASGQVAAFYHDEFVESQAKDFDRLVLTENPTPALVADIGGGFGYFAETLQRAHGLHVRVVDLDPASVAACKAKGVEAKIGNALSPESVGDETVVCFNLILHHLVADSERKTRALQERALSYWEGRPVTLFVNEYIYDSFLGQVSGRLIYEITKNTLLSKAGGLVARFVPSLKANTFGVGVRFRAHEEWLELFRSQGFSLVSHARGAEEEVSLARRMLLIRSCRRDSYVLRSTLAPPHTESDYNVPPSSLPKSPQASL